MFSFRTKKYVELKLFLIFGLLKYKEIHTEEGGSDAAVLVVRCVALCGTQHEQAVFLKTQ